MLGDCWSRVPQLQEKLLHWDREVKEEQYLSGQEERAQPLHLRQQRRQEGSTTLIKEKEQQGEALKTKNYRKRSPYP